MRYFTTLLFLLFTTSSFAYEMTIHYLNCGIRKINFTPDWTEITYSDSGSPEYLKGEADVFIGNIKSDVLNDKWDDLKKVYTAKSRTIDFGKSITCEVISQVTKDGDNLIFNMFIARFTFNERKYLLSIGSYNTQIPINDLVKNSLDTLWININK